MVALGGKQVARVQALRENSVSPCTNQMVLDRALVGMAWLLQGASSNANSNAKLMYASHTAEPNLFASC